MPRNNEHTIGSPEWWREQLLKTLADQQRHIAIFDEYYEGDHRLQFATTKFRKIFGEMFDHFNDNWCELVVDAVEERLDVAGFRFGTDDAQVADKDAWNIWQRNQMDMMSQQAITEALINGESSVMVWADKDQQPVITAEHPEQMVVMADPANPLVRTAALKLWRDDWGFDNCTLYLPDAIYKWNRPATNEATEVSARRVSWDERNDDDGVWPLPNPLGVVPVVPIVNRPRLLKPGKSEIANVIPTQDAVNKLLTDMIVTSEFQAFRQRWATGLEVPALVDDDGTPLEPSVVFQHAVDRLWFSEDTETKFGEFSATDLGPFVTGINLLVQHIASRTRTPPHYFYLSGSFPSGESIKSAETGLVAKARRKSRTFGEGFEEVMRLAFRVDGNETKGQQWDAETIWADMESRSESEHVDATVKKQALSVPVQQLWEDVGYTPKQIERFRAMLQQQAADQSSLAMEFTRMLDAAGVDPTTTETDDGLDA